MHTVRIVTIAASVVWTGCLLDLGHGDGNGSPILGSRRDVTTEPGVYNGVEVTEACDDAESFGLLAIEPTEPDPELTGTEHHEMTRALVDAQLANKGIEGSSGWGTACEGLGATFSVHDWADVDPLIDAMLPVVREANIVNDIVIRVERVPVAD